MGGTEDQPAGGVRGPMAVGTSVTFGFRCLYKLSYNIDDIDDSDHKTLDKFTHWFVPQMRPDNR